MEVQGLNDIRPFLLTWNYENKSYSFEIPKEFSQEQYESGWDTQGFHVQLEAKQGDDDGNGEHRYWRIEITRDDKSLANGDVSWSEFFIL